MFISESETQETTGPEKMQMTHIMVIIGINYLTYSRIDHVTYFALVGRS
jgi:hypothetical protein